MAILPRAEHDLDTGRRPGSERVPAASAGTGPSADPQPFAVLQPSADPDLPAEPQPAAGLDPELARELGDVVRTVDFVASGATRWVMLAGLRRAPEIIALTGENGGGVSLRLDSPTSILIWRDGD